jgi:thiamine pyrophosphokinase
MNEFLGKRVLVVANGEPPSLALLETLLVGHDLLVAVDGGLYACLSCGREPDLLIGDFDSVNQTDREKFAHIPQIYTPEQDKSDLEKALTFLEGGEITVCGALGKRIDHTLTNIRLLCRYPAKVKFETESEVCFALAHTNELACHKGQTLSLIPMSNSVEGVVTRGLKWELKGEVLDNHFVGLSNRCLQTSVSISLKTGQLIVCLLKREV